MSVYGGLVIKPVNNTVNEEVEQIFEETCFGNITGVAFSEFQNYLSMLSECTDESERTLLETKIEVLQEVSVKEIKDNIKKFISKIIQFIKDTVKKIKEFFTDKKKSYYKSKCSDLEKKLKESELMNEKLKADVSAAKKDTEKANTRAEEIKDLYDAKSFEYKTLQLDYDDLKKDLDDADNKRIEAEATRDKVLKIAEKIINNDLLYFDAYDYMKKDYDSHIFDALWANLDAKYNIPIVLKAHLDQIIDEFIKTKQKYIHVVNDETKKELENLNHGFTLEFDLRENTIREYINNCIHKKPRITDMNKLMEQIKCLSEGSQIDRLDYLFKKYQALVSDVPRNFDRVFEGETNSDMYIRTGKCVNKLCRILQVNVRLLYIFSQYASRAYGAACQAIDVLEGVYGIERPKW